jgi:hypothetical protein
VGGSACFRPRLSLSVPLAEQRRQRSAKPRRRVRPPHGTPFSAGISVERYTSVFQTGVEGALPSCPSTFSERSLKGASARPSGLLREQERAEALPRWPCANTSDHSRDAKPGGRQDFTGLVVAVQLRRRVAFGLQALQRCSGLLNRRARGSTVAAHHFKGVEVRLKNSVEVPHSPCARRRGCLCLLILPLVSPSSDAVGNSESAARSDLLCSRSSKYQSGRLRTARLQVRVLPGAPFLGMWFNPNSRGFRFRI